jgi:hypothetical protein
LYGKWRGPGAETIDCYWCSVHGGPVTIRARLSLRRAAAMMHMSSSWMFGEEEGFFRDLTGRNSGRRTSGCGQAVRSGSGGELSSDESEFLRKRTPKENRE